MTAGVVFAGIEKRFGPIRALMPTDLDVAPGEFVTLLGPSGSGKTTLLNICAGYLEATDGRVLIDGRDVTRLPARRRNIGMVFQNYALFPHMTVAENVAYGLTVRRIPKPEIARRVTAALDMVQMAALADRSVKNISGGQQQRVALARAMVIEPSVLLMDEPLGALDRQLRKHVQLEIRRLHVAQRRTTLYVTHDQEEALVMSDRIAVMRDGRIAQIGTARDLYDRPTNSFVARFLGESNLLPGRVAAADGIRARLEVAGIGLIEGDGAGALEPGAAASVLIRPEAIRLGPDQPHAARVVERVYLGELTAFRLTVAGHEVWCRMPSGLSDGVGDTTHLGWAADGPRVLPDDEPITNKGGM